MHRPHPELSFAQDKDGAAVLDPRNGKITTLNETGAFVWLGLIHGKPVVQVVSELARATETAEAIVAQGVQVFLSEPRIIALFEE